MKFKAFGFTSHVKLKGVKAKKEKKRRKKTFHLMRKISCHDGKSKMKMKTGTSLFKKKTLEKH